MTGRDASAGRQAGFSAIEAIAALAILSLAMLPLLELQAQSARAAIAMRRASGETTAAQSALAFIEVLNPMRDPSGQEDLGAFTLRWRSVPLSEERPAYQPDGTPGRFSLRLYEVTYELEGRTGAPVAHAVHKTGWRATAPVFQDETR